MSSLPKIQQPQTVSEIPVAWILQLENRVLRSLVQHAAAHIHPLLFQIDAINQTCTVPVSHAVLAGRLESAAIFLTPRQIKWVNIENRQMYYRHLIENNVLRESAKGFCICANQWRRSAEKKIKLLNALLERRITPKMLAKALAAIGITLNNDQLRVILEESQRHQNASSYLRARNACEDLQFAISTLNIRAIKKYYAGYLSLIMNESALSDYTVEELKTEIRLKIDDPYWLSVKTIREQAEELFRRKDELLKQPETFQQNKIIEKIEKTLAILEAAPYRLLLRQQWTLERWVNVSGVSDSLHQEIAALAPNQVLCHSEANRLYEKLHRKSRRALGVCVK